MQEDDKENSTEKVEENTEKIEENIVEDGSSSTVGSTTRIIEERIGKIQQTEENTLEGKIYTYYF